MVPSSLAAGSFWSIVACCGQSVFCSPTQVLEAPVLMLGKGALPTISSWQRSLACLPTAFTNISRIQA